MLKYSTCAVLFLAFLATGCGDSRKPLIDDVEARPSTSADDDTFSDEDASAGNDASVEVHHAIAVDDTTFSSTVLASEQPVLVDFWAPWCGPCRQLNPVVEQIAAEYGGRITVAKVNVDEAPDVAAKYDVTAIPTLVFLQNGQLVESIKGVQSKRRITQTLDAMLAE